MPWQRQCNEMGFEINFERFIKNIVEYAEQTGFDYTYYLTMRELDRMQIPHPIDRLTPDHLAPILLFLRDWMPGGWVKWSEDSGRRWQFDSELCEALKKSGEALRIARDLDLAHFDPASHGKLLKDTFERICELRMGSSKEAIATVASKVLHLLNPKLFVMWDTKIIDRYEFEADPEGYLRFLVEMKKLATQLNSHSMEISETTEKIRKKSDEIYGTEFCMKKSMAKLLDEYNWIDTHWRKAGTK